jgi:hypothetical protein
MAIIISILMSLGITFNSDNSNNHHEKGLYGGQKFTTETSAEVRGNIEWEENH